MIAASGSAWEAAFRQSSSKSRKSRLKPLDRGIDRILRIRIEPLESGVALQRNRNRQAGHCRARHPDFAELWRLIPAGDAARECESADLDEMQAADFPI